MNAITRQKNSTMFWERVKLNLKMTPRYECIVSAKNHSYAYTHDPSQFGGPLDP